MTRASLEDIRSHRPEVLVIGGGIYGMLSALDAGRRGLRTVLIDAGDFGGITSHNSHKVMHGGMRYVQHLDFQRLRASARERAFWRRAFPGRVTATEFAAPLFGYATRGPEAFRAAAVLYNMASAGLRGPGFPAAKVIGRKAAEAMFGDYAAEGMRGAGLWHDGQIADINSVHLSILGAAAEAGVLLANHTAALSLEAEDGRIARAVLADTIGGGEITVEPQVTLVTAGSATVDLVAQALGQVAPGARAPAGAVGGFPGFLRATNLVIDRPAPAVALGVVSRAKSDAVIDRGGRMYFAVPWRGRIILGTQEEPASDRVIHKAADVDPFLEAINAVVPALAFTRKDVAYVYQGLIPSAVDDGRTAGGRMTRGTLIDHAEADGMGGLISAIGVKYTTARLIAARAVDVAAAQIAAQGGRRVGPSTTLDCAFPPAEDLVLDLDDPASIAARVASAVGEERAVRLGDVVFGRSDVAERGDLTRPGGAARLERLASAMADALGWDAARRSDEIATVTARIGHLGIDLGAEAPASVTA